MKKLIFLTLSIFCCMSAFAQWQVVYSDTNVTFYGVHAVDTNIVYACGTGGTIVKSTDGGDTWHKQITPTTQNLVSIKFLDSLYGYAVGNNGTVLKTENGGTLWQSLNTETNAHYYRINLLNKDAAYVIGNYSANTTYDIFADMNRSFRNSTIDSSIILKTTNAGTSWHSVFSKQGKGQGITGLCFIDTLTGFISVIDSIFKTTDGGINWKSSKIDDYPLDYNSDIFFVKDSTVYVGGYGGILKSTDKGESFFYIEGTSYNFNYANFLCFPSPQIGYIAGLRHVLPTNGITVYPFTMKSMDLGNTWGYQMISKTIREYNFPARTNINFPSENYGFLIAKDILRTQNGGGELLDYPYTEFIHSIRDVHPQLKVYITPNPVSTQFYITGDITQITHVLLTDILGKEVKRWKNIRQDTEFDIRNLPKGTYLVQICTKSGTYTQKLIKQ